MRLLHSEKTCQEIMLKSLIFGVKNGFNMTLNFVGSGLTTTAC